MNKQSLLKPLLLALAAAFPLANYADDAASPAPGSWQAIMSVKDPANYGRHLPAADQPPHEIASLPPPGTTAALLAAKDPASYARRFSPTAIASGPATGSFARFESVKALPPAPAPGSFEAIIRSKDPMFFTRGTRSN